MRFEIASEGKHPDQFIDRCSFFQSCEYRLSPGHSWQTFAAYCLMVFVLLGVVGEQLSFGADPIFETDVRPILLLKCGECHGEQVREANLDLRSVSGIQRGGDSGPAIAEVSVNESLLIERIESGEMPPEDHPQLTSDQIAKIRRWVETGARSNAGQGNRDEWTQRMTKGRAYWAFQPPTRPVVPGSMADPISSSAGERISPRNDEIRPHLQAWYRAESISLRDGERVVEWTDESGNERHLRPTWNRVDALVGAPPRWLRSSTIGNRPAVRFNQIAGLSSPAEKPVEIVGDVSWTITIVVNMRPPSQDTHSSVLIGFGDPVAERDPGRPFASLLEIDRAGGLLSHSGGHSHDVRSSPQSIWALYDKPLVISLVKRAGPMAPMSSLFVNGHRVHPFQGSTTNPEIRHRTDLGIFLGRAHESLGAFRGDLAEAAIYDIALNDSQRRAVEAGLIEKYDILVSARELENRVPHPVDAFIQAKLQENKLTAAPLANRRTLIRRAYFDLIGLPPKPQEIEAFVNDSATGAWERVIERLLHSKHYGERWGRHWLDVARYADTGGYETDIYHRNAWRFRDYVVKSFNDDKPYDQFVQEQIAGDEIWADNLDLTGSYVMDPEKKRHFEALTGTGFYVLGPQIHESNMDAKKLANERLADWVDTTAAAFMGLTFGCARCHDHKFDPISQRDYYALQAVFASSREIEVPMQHGMGLADWKQHYPKLLAVEEARKAYRAFEDKTSGDARTQVEEQRLQELKMELADRLLAIPEKDAQGDLYVGVYERPTVSVLGHYRAELTPEVRLLSRGDLTRPKQSMSPRLPKLLAQLTEANSLLTDDSSGRRKQFALWLTRPDHPLTARVMANRIWQWHFGRGIVSTSNDFGQMGALPTHPELLDWLSSEFIARGWSIKSMHRLIMTSQTYRRSSVFYTDEHGQRDPDNELLWRMNRRRLEGEAIWDAVHSVANTINLALGGRPVMPPLLAEELTSKSNWVESQMPVDHTRRGLYIVVRRNFNFPLFDLFDAPVNAVSCSGRDASTVAPQALWLLNNHLGFDQAKHFAMRLVREAGTESVAQIKLAWQVALGRPASDKEVNEAIEFLERCQELENDPMPVDKQLADLSQLSPQRAAALTKLCLAIFNLNEFVYVD